MSCGQTRGKTNVGARYDQFANRLYIDPASNILVGAQAICHYMGVASINTLVKWVEEFGFPAIKRPDGLWITSMTAVDQWIFLAAEVTNENTAGARAARRAARGVGLLPGRKTPKVPYLTSGFERMLRDVLRDVGTSAPTGTPAAPGDSPVAANVEHSNDT